MSVSRDDFSIAFRSALLQRGATHKFSIFSLIIIVKINNDKIENFCAPPL